MTDERADRDGQTPPPFDTAGPNEAATGPGGTPDRRTFIRQLSGDALVSAGRIAGLSSAVRRSLLAAGVSATRELDGSATREPAAASEPPSAQLLAGPPTSSIDAQRQPQPATRPAVDPVAALTSDQHDFLAHGHRAVLAVNDPTGPPHLSSSMYHWDGAILRLPAQMFAARAQHVDRDPRVSVFIEDRSSGALVVVSGVASLVYGDAVGLETMLVLTRYLPRDDAVARWDEMRGRGDAVVIQVRPTRFLWRTA